MADNKPKYSVVFVILITICVAILAASLYASGALEKFELFTLDYRLFAASIPSVPLSLDRLHQTNSIPSENVLQGQGKELINKRPKCDVILIDMPASETNTNAAPDLKDCAIVTRILTVWGAKAIVFADLLPEQTGGTADADLVEVALESKGLYLPALYDIGNDGSKYVGETAKGVKEPWQVLMSPTVSVGHINAFPDIDGKLRRLPVFIQNNGRRVYQLGVKAAMNVIGVKDGDVEFDSEAHTLVFKPNYGERITIPLEQDNQLTVKWALRDGARLQRVPFRDILESYRLMQYGARPIIDPNIFSGNICILGTAASNGISARPPFVKEGRATSAACGFIASNILNEDFVRRMPKALDIALILSVTLLFGAALSGFHFLRFMMIVVVAIVLFSLASAFHMSQDMMMIIVILLSIPLGIFIANSQVFSGLIFAILSIVGYYIAAVGLFNTYGFIIPIFFPISAMVVTFILFYTYTRFKDFLGKMRLFSLASKDGLTKLTNRRYLNMLLDSELNSAVLDKTRKLSIIMCDIDDFKKLNDAYGHQAGDAVLKKIAIIIKSKCRQWDIVARYGGEEFVIILPGAAAKGALGVAEGIRQAITEEKFIYKGHSFTASISMGLAEYSNERTKEDLLEKADQALYRAKREGKNRVCQ